ncbi:hypothetical protein dsx2_2431 [Desulfovibrio sp. X2]|uniref:hypothetical protein n=1 Tax=Desulfovibrio sp. X2 TaxID=941449 RepID=UPI000358C13B|nr:hypothetical protein [Desulfovibrio sp. X2]EPR43387.1 hypothetical protein dsx2_2431 [Desulfovibrio sp. X2]
MKKTTMALVVVCALAALALSVSAGCGLKPAPMDISDFRFQCRFASSPGTSGRGDNNDGGGGVMGCDPFVQEQICNDYSSRLEAFNGDLQQCLNLCAQMRNEVASNRVYNPTCGSVTAQVDTICSLYCRRNYEQ